MRIDAPIFTGSFSLNGSTLQNLSAVSTTGSNTFVGNQNVQGYISASALTGSIDFTNLTNSPTLVSGSSQVVNILSSLNTATASFTPRITNLESTSASVDISITNINSVTASNIARLTNLESTSASVDISITNINSVTASNIARLNNLETKSASVDVSITNINSFTASNNITSLNSKTGSYATTGSNTFFGTQTYSGSVYIANDLIVQGSSSIQYISASSVSIGTNIVQLNTANPSVRFAGLTMIDSGSVGGSGSFLYDSLQDEFIFVHRGNGTNVTSSHFVTGPETYDSLGNETYLTTNILTKGTGKEHLIDSCIFDNGTTTCIKNNLVGTGTITGTTIYGSTITCSPIGCFATSCATSFIGGTMSGTTIYGSTAVCSAVGKFTTCLDLGGALTGTSAKFNSYFGTDMGSGGIYFSGNAGPDIAYIGYNYTNINGTEATYQSSRSSWRQHFGNGSTNQWKVAYRAPDAAASSWTDYLTIASTGAATFSSSVTAAAGNFSGDVTIAKTTPGLILNGLGSGNSGAYINLQGWANTYSNWQIGVANLAGSVGLGFTPSTTVGGTTFTTPVFTLSQTGAATFSSNVTATDILTINGSSSGKVLKLNSKDNLGDNYIEFNQNDGTRQGYIGYGYSGYNYMEIYQSANEPIMFSTNATERMRITSGGLIGMNQPAPSYRLEICSPSSTCLLGLMGASNVNIDMVGFGTSLTYPQARIQLQDDGYYGGMLSFFTKPNGAQANALTERMRICSNGDLTIKGSTHCIYTNSGATISFDINVTRGRFYQALTVDGTVTKGGGSFKIDHPLESKKDTYNLYHSFVESPKADLIYRGKVTLTDGYATVNIDTAADMSEGTFEVLVKDVQCFTTNENGWNFVKGTISGNILTIESDNTSCNDEISWMVIGERNDKWFRESTMVDENGKTIVEKLKSETT